MRRAPERTTQERRSALEEANRVRFARAATKRRLKSGEIGIYELNDCVQDYKKVPVGPLGTKGLDKGVATSYRPKS